MSEFARWRNHAEHKLAPRKSYETWYRAFATRVCLVERDNFFEK